MTRNGNSPSWLKPLWRRIALVAFCAIWAAWELYNGATGWAALAAGMAIYGAWIFIYTWTDPEGSGPPGSGSP